MCSMLGGWYRLLCNRLLFGKRERQRGQYLFFREEQVSQFQGGIEGNTKGGIPISLGDKINQLKGAVKEGVGKISGDVKAEKEGAAEWAAAKAKEVAEDTKKVAKEAAEKASAKAKEVAGNVKDALEGTLDGVKNILNEDKE